MRIVFHSPCSQFPGPVSVCVYVSARVGSLLPGEACPGGHDLWPPTPCPFPWGRAGQSHLSPSEHSSPVREAAKTCPPGPQRCRCRWGPVLCAQGATLSWCGLGEGECLQPDTAALPHVAQNSIRWDLGKKKKLQ